MFVASSVIDAAYQYISRIVVVIQKAITVVFAPIVSVVPFLSSSDSAWILAGKVAHIVLEKGLVGRRKLPQSHSAFAFAFAVAAAGVGFFVSIERQLTSAIAFVLCMYMIAVAKQWAMGLIPSPFPASIPASVSICPHAFVEQASLVLIPPAPLPPFTPIFAVVVNVVALVIVALLVEVLRLVW